MNNTKELPKYITDEKTGIKYELVGDYYFIAGDDEPEEKQRIGKWGRLRDEYLKKTHRAFRSAMITCGELRPHLARVEVEAEELFSQLVKQFAERQGVNEALKASDQMEWVRRMGSICSCAEEIVRNEVIYA